jgi:hypothetical protein
MTGRGAIAAALTVLGAVVSGTASGQTIRRPQPRAFRFSITPQVGLGWGGVRARETDVAYCASVPCIQHRLGSSPVVGAEAHIPLPGPIAVGVVVSGARPNRLFCSAGTTPRYLCDARERVTLLRAATLLLWRFHPRAPMYLGIGPAVAHIAPGPVYSQRSAVTEIGGSLVAAYDVRTSSRFAIRAAWWNYLMMPRDADLAAAARPATVAWDTHVALGVAVSFGSPTVRRPPRTFTPPPGQ